MTLQPMACLATTIQVGMLAWGLHSTIVLWQHHRGRTRAKYVAGYAVAFACGLAILSQSIPDCVATDAPPGPDPATPLYVTAAPPTTSALVSSPYYPIRLLAVVDGDTVKCDVELGFGVVLADQTVRLDGFDGAELSRRRRTVGEITDEELEVGRRAREALVGLLAGGRAYLMPSEEVRDVYGRLLGRLSVEADGEVVDVARWMEEQGYSRGRFEE